MEEREGMCLIIYFYSTYDSTIRFTSIRDPRCTPAKVDISPNSSTKLCTYFPDVWYGWYGWVWRRRRRRSFDADSTSSARRRIQELSAGGGISLNTYPPHQLGTLSRMQDDDIRRFFSAQSIHPGYSHHPLLFRVTAPDRASSPLNGRRA